MSLDGRPARPWSPSRRSEQAEPIGDGGRGYRNRMARSPVDLFARTAGGALAAGAGALGAVMQRVKPLHPEGELRRATLTHSPPAVASGVPWLDSPGQDDAVVRVSRAVGLPDALPDVQGLAVRVVLETGAADLLLASTGLGVVTRYVLMPTRRITGRPLTTLLPYRSPRGPLLLAAAPESEHAFELRWAGPAGPWHAFGRLDLGAPFGDDLQVSFDPVVNVAPGLSHYSWVRTLREPAYWTARTRTHRAVTPSRRPSGRA